MMAALICAQRRLEEIDRGRTRDRGRRLDGHPPVDLRIDRVFDAENIGEDRTSSLLNRHAHEVQSDTVLARGSGRLRRWGGVIADKAAGTLDQGRLGG
jgi:hypothetical protein